VEWLKVEALSSSPVQQQQQQKLQIARQVSLPCKCPAGLAPALPPDISHQEMAVTVALSLSLSLFTQMSNL
jgi:hypothetical protein